MRKFIFLIASILILATAVYAGDNKEQPNGFHCPVATCHVTMAEGSQMYVAYFGDHLQTVGLANNVILLRGSISETAAKATPTPSPTPLATSTPLPTLLPTLTPTPLPTGVSPNAPLCDGHNNSVFHTLWNGDENCHYDHEHGENPFTPEVAAAFPGFDLFSLLGNIQIGHTNPSSSHENTDKHGGNKWEVMVNNPHGCVGGFELATYCVMAAAVQYHTFGDYSEEMNTSLHSTASLFKACNPANPTDCGIAYTTQHQQYGQCVVPYQGTVVPCPGNPSPVYNGGFGQYFTIDCVGAVPQCRSSIAMILNMGLSVNSIWTSKPTGAGVRPPGSTIFKVLFRVRDLYQVFDWTDQTHPFTFRWVCGDTAYNPVGCRYNNTTTAVHEVAGTIPAAWDGLAGFDTNPTVGRITAEGFTDRFGTHAPTCTVAGGDCFPIKLDNMFVGTYGDYLTLNKVSTTSPVSNPERDYYFCNGVLCSETTPGAVASGWVGSEN